VSDDEAGAVEIVELTHLETHPLRLAVLRADTPTRTVAFAEDTWPGAVHLGARIDGRLVATSSWIPRAAPDATLEAVPELDASTPAVQLRGMATAHAVQGTGVGGVLLRAGVERAREAGAAVVWANARDAALAFYVRHGFTSVGDGFVDATTQLPHHVVVIRC
jgi:GNAT superfamily N-acetyltransferase